MRPDKGKPKTDITGRTFGRLTALRFDHMGDHGSVWECVCICGNTTFVRINHLTGNKTLSCGCLRKDNFDAWREDKHGAKNAMWKGGKITVAGYTKLITPFKDRHGRPKYKYEHRIVMEKIIGRELTVNEVVHHKNGIKTDNRPENLELLTKNTHKGKVECPHCHNHFLIR